MRWSLRQRAMLAAMGLRLWTPVRPPENAVAGPGAPEPGQRREADALDARETAVPEIVAVETVAVETAATTLGEAPRESAIAAMDWAALRDAVQNCKACGLCAERRNTVFGVGDPHARWMIVGEAPGEQEDMRGEPFVGKSGQLLDAMLFALQLSRAEDAAQGQRVYIANTVKCRPPGNRNPDPAEIAKCEPYLARQIELVAPAVIVAMGRVAAQSLLQSTEPLGRLRGRVHRYRGLPLVATYHPAYLLRNPPDKARAWEDLCLARELARGTER